MSLNQFSEVMSWSPASTRVPSGVTSLSECRCVSGVSALQQSLCDRLSYSPPTSRPTLPDMIAVTTLESSGEVPKDQNPFSDVRVDKPGLSVWRVQFGRLRSLETKEHGFFEEVGSYLVLKVNEDKTSSIHVWFGKKASMLETTVTAADKFCRELDELVHKAVILTREVEAHETILFLRNFPEGIVYLKSKAKAGENAKPSKYDKKLYVIRGRKFAIATTGTMSQEVLDPTAAILLDGFPRMYLWMGPRTDAVTCIKAIQLTKRLRALQRNGRAYIVVIDKNDKDNSAAFLKKLPKKAKSGPQTDVHSSSSAADKDSDDTASVMNLYKVSGNRVLHDMPLAASRPLKQRFLVSTDSYILDRGTNLPLFIWVGSKAGKQDIIDAISRSRKFADHLGYPSWLPVCRLLEGQEPSSFKSCFRKWKEPFAKTSPASYRYGIGGIERVLFSRCESRATSRPLPPAPDMDLKAGDSTEMFRVDNAMNTVQCPEPGVFDSSESYIILHRRNPLYGAQPSNVIFYWLGRRSGSGSQAAALALSLTLSSQLDSAVVVRAMEGREPRSFMTVFDNSIVVNNTDAVLQECQVKMYQVREWVEGGIRVQQMLPTSTGLNSSATYVLLAPTRTILWYGKFTGGLVRQFAKDILAFLDRSRSLAYEIVMEGKEPENFWDLVGPREPYPDEFDNITLIRRSPRLTWCCRSDSDVTRLEDVESFTQEDLCESEIFILDTFDQVFLWSGESVDDNTRQTLLLELFHEYISCDPAQRTCAEVQLWLVRQGSEPEIFVQSFPSWREHGYSRALVGDRVARVGRQQNPECFAPIFTSALPGTGSAEQTYQQLRKTLRQENARLNLEGRQLKYTTSTYQGGDDMSFDLCSPLQCTDQTGSDVKRPVGSSRDRACQERIVIPPRSYSSLSGSFSPLQTA